MLTKARRALLCCAIFALTPLANGQQPSSFADNAKTVAAAMEAGRDRVSPTRSGKWVKIREKASAITYDVKKTDSALDPLQGQLELSVFASFTVSYATEQEASAAADFALSEEFKLRATYVPSGQGWALKTASYLPRTIGKWLDVKPETLRTPTGALSFPQKIFLEFETK